MLCGSAGFQAQDLSAPAPKSAGITEVLHSTLLLTGFGIFKNLLQFHCMYLRLASNSRHSCTLYSLFTSPFVVCVWRGVICSLHTADSWYGVGWSPVVYVYEQTEEIQQRADAPL